MNKYLVKKNYILSAYMSCNSQLAAEQMLRKIDYFISIQPGDNVDNLKFKSDFLCFMGIEDFMEGGSPYIPDGGVHVAFAKHSIYAEVLAENPQQASAKFNNVDLNIDIDPKKPQTYVDDEYLSQIDFAFDPIVNTPLEVSLATWN